MNDSEHRPDESLAEWQTRLAMAELPEPMRSEAVRRIIYHAVNGLKIMVFDFWPSTTRHMKGISATSTAIFLLCMLPIVWIMGREILDLLGVL